MRRVLVTGASRGIGQGVAVRLARDGFFVVVHYGHDEQGAQDTLAHIEEEGGQGSLIKFDVGDTEQCRQQLEAEVEAHGAFYGVVSNAGITRGDIAESTATARIFGHKTPISTLKSYFGHTLGACGAVEALAAVKMMHEGWFNPNLNLNHVDPECGDLDYIVGEKRNIDTDLIVTNNFAFGGINTSIVLKRL